MANFLIAAALANLTLPLTAAVTPANPDADPAIWVVNDEDTVVFLFGTFHALDGRSDWFNDEVMTAFASSDELVLETVIPNASGKIENAPLVAAKPVTPSRKGVAGHSVAPTASFLASTRMAISAGRASGMTVEKGADEILRRAAQASGKPVEGLEAFEQQLQMFMKLPAPRGSTTPAHKNHTMRNMSRLMAVMQAAWNRGDQLVFARVVEQLRQSSPDTYKMMFTDRNASWASWIAQRMQKPGTVFVAVGAGHLAGMDSVQQRLSELGVRSERIN